MKKIKLVFILLFAIIGCSPDDDNIDKKNETEEIILSFVPNSQIEIEKVNELALAKVVKGEKLVFKYSFSDEGNLNIADDEYYESILFQVPKGVNEFVFKNKDLVEALVYFDSRCFCPSKDSLVISKGEITGKKVNEKEWEINIDVELLVDDVLIEKKVQGNFIRKN